VTKSKIRKPLKGNNSRAYERRLSEGFYKKYIVGNGLDIGCSSHERSISTDVKLWDKTLGSGDATHMKGVPDNKYSYVMASHILEHIHDRETALKNWIRIVKPGGYLIVCVPDRDLYENKKTLPSKYNRDHKCFFLLDKAEKPDTHSFKETLEILNPFAELVYIKLCDDNWPGQDNVGPEHHRKLHPVGEFQIEAVLKKKEQ